MAQVAARDLELGDVVRIMDGVPYMDGTVVKVTEKFATLFRPFVHLSNYSSGSSVLHYVGTEKVDLWRGEETTTTYRVIETGRKFE